MLRVPNLALPVTAQDDEFADLAAQKLHIPRTTLATWRIVKKSVDARDKGDVRFVVTLDVKLKTDEQSVLKHAKAGVATIVAENKPHITAARKQAEHPPVVVGMGPCGLFAALTLARAGLKPIVFERGERVSERQHTVERFFADGTLNTESNVQFGEGGAGAFSDGKLTTGIKDKRCRDVLEIFHEHGAPDEILYMAHPHVGTDKLPCVVASIRDEIIRLGGQVFFNAKLTALSCAHGALCGITYNDKDGNAHEIRTDIVVLALGHSARDTQQMLYAAGLTMVQKPFSVGARIEQKQSDVNFSQYGKFAKHLGAAEYHLSCKTRSGRGAYTFCMCPGGSVVAAASQEGGVCVNGMSPFARDGENANAALLVDVRTEDFGDTHPLAGLVLQRQWEQRAFAAGGGNYRAPVQRVEDFLAGRASKALGEIKPTYRPGVTCADLRAVLPDFAVEGMRDALRILNGQMKGFAHPDAVLTGVETRSSSPVRVLRGADMQANITGLYPCGEGAGYAGGIMSAAVDGMKAAAAIMDALPDA